MSVFRSSSSSSSSFLTSSCVHKQQLELKPKPYPNTNPPRLRTGPQNTYVILEQSDFLVDVLGQIRMQDVRTGWTGYPQDIH
uniref:GG17144 n=1 Tax=Drosophila erecta TaxID=7220 RepID=B3P1E5_DROER